MHLERVCDKKRSEPTPLSSLEGRYYIYFLN